MGVRYDLDLVSFLPRAFLNFVSVSNVYTPEDDIHISVHILVKLITFKSMQNTQN